MNSLSAKSLAFAIALLLAELPEPLHAQQYSVTELQTPAGMSLVYGNGFFLNDHGEVAGAVYGSTHGLTYEYGAFWSGSSMPTIFGGQLDKNFPGVDAITGLNDAGTIVGSTSGADRIVTAVEWQGTRATALPPLPGNRGSYALGINSSGLIIGAASASSGNFNSVTWTGGVISDLGASRQHFGVGPSEAINNQGSFIGQASGGGAFVQNGTSVTLLPSLGSSQSTAPFGINDAGEIVGGSGGHAVEWVGSTVLDLGAGGANGINNSGQIVGFDVTPSTVFATLWNHGSVESLSPEPRREGKGLFSLSRACS